jgi:hypothetical protein
MRLAPIIEVCRHLFSSMPLMMSFDLSRLPLLVWGRGACRAGFERVRRWFWVFLLVLVECGEGAMMVLVDFVFRWFTKDGG